MVSMTFITIPLMDRLGRRVLQLISLLGTLVMAVLIVIAHNLEISGFLIATTLLFVVFFALGNGSIPWLITGEMFTQGYLHHHLSMINKCCCRFKICCVCHSCLHQLVCQPHCGSHLPPGPHSSP